MKTLIYNKVTKHFADKNVIDLYTAKPKKKYVQPGTYGEYFAVITEYILKNASKIKDADLEFTVKYPVSNYSGWGGIDYIFFHFTVSQDWRDRINTQVVMNRSVPGWINPSEVREIESAICDYEFTAIDELKQLQSAAYYYWVYRVQDYPGAEIKWKCKKVKEGSKCFEVANRRGLRFEEESSAKEFLARCKSGDLVALDIFNSNSR